MIQRKHHIRRGGGRWEVESSREGGRKVEEICRKRDYRGD